MNEAEAVWHSSARKTEIAPVLSPAGADCMIKAHYSLISTGTERLVASGKVPASLQQQMAVPYMEGNFELPIKYGYSLVGEVIEGPDEWVGEMVHLLHPHQNVCLVHASDLTLIPSDIPPLRAVLASNLETALNAVWDSGVSIGDEVLLIGFGIIGSLTARLLQAIAGVKVSVFDTDEVRCGVAEAMGFSLVDRFKEYDIAFHCSGSSAGLQHCIEHTGMEGKVVELSWYGEQAVNISLGGSFHYQRKQILSSQVSQIPANKSARWNYQRRKSTIMELLKDAAFDQHIGQTIDFKEVPSLFDKIRNGNLSQLSWAIDYT
ncbi:zinc-binding alcohol dehydrogenase [Porifericola rhodea]|uniref:zinc-dependent alcohol dehydrogenase n=1 Tax=Porifericola rhodea TaxID=930972 RepID=UPI002666290D|nr:zinc-binding alcohol dehydrogenase [Porifericola rhodea]WKN31915.1 zinc-binding alcohol dehydrogenase [Porifericola rhodea]